MGTITYKAEHNGTDSEFPFCWEVDINDGEVYYNGTEATQSEAEAAVASRIAQYFGRELKE